MTFHNSETGNAATTFEARTFAKQQLPLRRFIIFIGTWQVTKGEEA
jgi:hypothetical protein